MSKKKKAIKNPSLETKKVKEPKNLGYREFMSNFAGYARENNIKIHGGRGSFARQCAAGWKAVKNTPMWRDNLDVILPQYVKDATESIISKPKPVTPEGLPVKLSKRMAAIIQDIGNNEFNHWDVKSLYGIWHDAPMVDLEVDRLFVSDDTSGLTNISDDEDAYMLYKTLKDAVQRNAISRYSYIEFTSIDQNENGGVDLTYKIVDSDMLEMRMHEMSEYEWSVSVREKYGINRNLEPEAKTIKEEKKEKEWETWQKIKFRQDGYVPASEARMQGPSHLDELIKYKESLMSDIRFAKEMGDDYSKDMVKLKDIKSQIDDLMK